MSAAFPYCDLAEVKQAMKKEVAVDDPFIEALIVSACSAIDNYCGRPDGFRADGESDDAREFPGFGKPYITIDEAARVTLVEMKEASTDTDYTALNADEWIAARGEFKHPTYGDKDFQPYQWIMMSPSSRWSVFTSGRYGGVIRGFAPDADYRDFPAVPTVRVTANWGYSMEIPPPVKTAAIMQVERWFMRQRGVMADTATSPDHGIQTFRRMVETLDADVAMILVMGGLVRRRTP